MIFGASLLPLVLSGRKTQTRRLVHGAEVCRYHEGNTYAVQPGRGESGVARILVTKVRMQPLGEIRRKDARAEGFAGERAFRDYWLKLYGWYASNRRVWAISFELVR